MFAFIYYCFMIVEQYTKMQYQILQFLEMLHTQNVISLNFFSKHIFCYRNFQQSESTVVDLRNNFALETTYSCYTKVLM